MPGRKAPLKCRKCAALSIEQVHQLYGSPKTDPQNFLRDPNVQSDGCYDPKRCPSKRSYLRNADINNQKRGRKEQERQLERLQIEIDEPYQNVVYAILIVYREAGYDSIVHAISGSVWCGSEQIIEIAPIHCEELTPAGVHAYVRKVLKVLHERYGIRKFASLVRRDPRCCPIRPCIHHVEMTG